MSTITSGRPRKLVVTALVMLASGVVVNSLPQAMLYPAPRARVPEPPPPWSEVCVPLRGGDEVHGWWRVDPASGPALLFFHGNGESLATLGFGGFLERLAEIGSATLVVDYPGYGRSPGRPSEQALHAAADAALAWVKEHGNGRPVVAWGSSLGAAVAVPLAARAGERVSGLIAASPWTRLEDVAAEHFPRFLVRLLLSERYDSLSAAAAVRVPALVLHGEREAIIPAEHGRRVAATLGGPTRYVEIAETGHNDLLGQGQVWREAASFVASLQAAP